MQKPTLVVMAAGMGSRYGGLKQIDPVGKNGEIIMDFSVFDAAQAGFSKVIFIIKEQLFEDFKEVIGNLRTADPYMVLADYADYRRAQNDLSTLYQKRETWNRMSLANIANSGIFSADRSVFDYARDIWHTKSVK